MFSKAVPIAAGFTRPVVISSRTTQGACAGTIGAYVVINREGWILTAGHLLDIVRAQQDSARRHAGYQGNVVEFHRDTAADKRYRKKGVRTFHKPGASSVRYHSVWWGVDGVRLVEARVVPAADPGARASRAVRSRLRRALPSMEGPFAGLRAGAEPVQARLPPAPHRADLRREGEHVHLARGLGAAAALSHGRDVHPRVQRPGAGERDGEPSAFIETSTPSLIGQMGGPVFDADAVVWGVQSHTMHHALGFRPPVPGSTAAEVAHQFLNTGLAVHTTVIRRFLDAEGIAYASER